MACPSEGACEYAFYDFGAVSTGTRAFKTIKISNFRTISQCYEISRDPDTNPLDPSFYVHPWLSAEIKPQTSFLFDLEYAPVVPFTINYDYFNVSDSYGFCCKFGVKGKSFGPLVELSLRELLFTCVGQQKEVEKEVVLSNDSLDEAKFQFDIDKMHYFDVHPRQGVISPNSEITVTIKFTPSHPGVYSKYIFCLIQYQAPLLITVIGIYTFNETFYENNVPLRKFIQQQAVIGGFESYVNDSKHIVEYQPLIVLNRNYIDFGGTSVEDQKTQTVCLTNSIKTGVIVQWEEDSTGIFVIEPSKVKIAGDASAIFEVYFSPIQSNNVYSRELTAQVHWDENTLNDSLEMSSIICDVAVPITITLRLMGHSFQETCAIWAPEYNISSTTIRMPPCVPPLSVYNTFSIERLGLHPLMFKFIPPEVSHYVVKPMQGVITEEFQIIVVGVCPNTKEEAPYYERWILQFNGSPQYEIILDLCAYAEYPRLQVNEDNTVTFPPTFPGAEQTGQLCLKNFTKHCIWYRFSTDESDTDLRLIEDEGSIASNEITYINWQFAPKRDGFKIRTVMCDTCALLDCWCPLGTFVGTTITVYTESEYTELVSFPSQFDCGVLTYKMSKTIQFNLFNFGRCKINFALKCISVRDVANFSPDDIQIHPISSKIEPYGNVPICVVITPTHLGEHSLALAYETLQNGKSVNNAMKGKVTVTTVRYESVLAYVQIADINFIGAGPFVSKLWMWKMLNIDSINTILRGISPGESSSVQINLPHAVMNSEPLTVYMLIQNESEVKGTWKLKHIVTCKCVVREDYMSRRVFRYTCAHRDQICVKPVCGELEGKNEAIMVFKVNYNVLGQNETLYKMCLGHQRTITISFIVCSLPPDICSPSVYSTKLEFQGVYIGENYPSIQAYWIYNAADKQAFYSIDLRTLQKYNIQNMCEIFTCVNPSGTILPRSSHPVLFQFAPRTLDSYEVNVPICLGTQNYYNLCIEGEGLISFQSNFIPLASKQPNCSIFDVDEILVFLSTDSFLVEPLITHSQKEHIIFITNRSSTTSVGFSWQKYCLPEFLTCTVKPVQGILRPMEAKMCKLIITSYFQPCLITVQIPCEFINLNLCQKREEAATLFSHVKQHQCELFTINEKGIFKPDCDINLISSPKPFYRVLSVTCNVLNSLNIDAKLNPTKQFKLYPSAEATVRPNCSSVMPVSKINTLKILQHVIDTLIWDMMFSARFQNAVESIKYEESVFYGQFVMDSRKEKELIAFQKHTIPKHILAKIIRGIIYEVFQGEYNINGSGDFSSFKSRNSF